MMNRGIHKPQRYVLVGLLIIGINPDNTVLTTTLVFFDPKSIARARLEN